LLVEDNEVNQIVANGLLKMMGFEIVLAENGAIALELIGQQHFDLVMMDIQMPVMDGISATREIRSRWPDLQLPIIALTAHAFDEEVERCRAVGMDAVLTKPIEPPKLHSLLDDFLGEAGVAAKATTELAVTPALESVAEPVSVEAAPAATLPSVVLDRSIGLYYAGDDTAIYQHALVSFKAKVSGLPEALEALLAAGRTDEARRMVHTVRGVAGAVGAMRLQKIVADLEGQIYAGRLAELDDLLGLLQRELVVVLGEVDSELAP
jgi:CheY-like chemotaxis protein